MLHEEGRYGFDHIPQGVDGGLLGAHSRLDVAEQVSGSPMIDELVELGFSSSDGVYAAQGDVRLAGNILHLCVFEAGPGEDPLGGAEHRGLLARARFGVAGLSPGCARHG
jgi:hypothetical protein